MAAELKARKDMDKRYMWDLTQIYKTNEDWEKAFEELQASIPDVGKYSGTMGTPEGARAALDGFYDLVYKSMLMYLYAELNKSGDNGDPEYQAMNERAMMLLVQLNTAASYITPELATLHRDPASLPSCPGAGAVPPPNSGYNPRAQACALP